ncbi:MAG: ATP-binding protein [Roseiflexus sp.]|nr:ATP-binding protein [Roseiflexus sp.]MCS7287842.1 ATP-binding protein [Roseiflexus sp.]MDW8233474.1 ATP-binding protein [Roseiflexaceae bacterium]
MSLRDALSRPIIEPIRRRTADVTFFTGATTLPTLLAPDGIDRRWSHMVQVGDSFITALEVRAFPPALALAWLDDPALGLDGAGITVHQHLVPIPDALARRWLARSEDAALGTLAGDAQAGTHFDAEAQQGIEAAAALRHDLTAGTDRLFQIAITITVAAATPEELAARVDRVRLAAAQRGILLGSMQFQQWEGYLDALPLGRTPAGLLHDASGRAAAMGMPTASPGLTRRGGLPIVWGEHPRSGAPVVYDRWQATNPHMLIVAESGSGKTYTMGGLLAQELALGEDALLILDPKRQEYRALTMALGGAYISLSSRAGYHINPLELPPLAPERARTVAALEEDLLAQRISVIKALITRELKAQGTHVDATGAAAIQDAIAAAYAARGISSDPRTFMQPMPTFSDVQQRLAEIAPDLARAMALFTRGIIGDLFNHPSNVPTDNPLLAIDLWTLLQSNDETLARLLPVIVMDFFVTTAINRPTGRRSHLVLDEAHALLHSEAGARTLQMIFRIGRSLQFKATVITQSLDDLDESEQTRVLLENARTKLILGLNQDSDAVNRAAAILRLNDEEAAYLATCRIERGIGATALLLADGERTPLFIPRWPDAIHRIVTGAGSER